MNDGPQQPTPREDKTRTVNRYSTIIKLLGFTFNDLNEKSPDDSEAMINARLDEIRQTPSEAKILFGEGDTVTLAGKSYEIKPLPIDDDLAWRKKAGEIAQDLATHLFALTQASLPDPPTRDENEPLADWQARTAKVLAKAREDQKMEALSAIFPYVFGEGLDKLAELLFTYSEEMRADEKHIRATATSDEMIAAAMTGLEVAFPFVINLVTGIMKLVKRGEAAGLGEALKRKMTA